MHEIRGYHIATFHQRKLYIIGGVTPVFNDANIQKEFPTYKEYVSCMMVNVYDIDTEKWTRLETTGTEVPALENSCCCCHNDSIYIFGGWTGHTHVNDMFELSLQSLSWKKVPSSTTVPSPRAGCSMNVTCEGMFLLFGGQGPVAVDNVWGTGSIAATNNSGTRSVSAIDGNEIGSTILTIGSGIGPTVTASGMEMTNNDEVGPTFATNGVGENEFPMATYIRSDKYSHDNFNNQLFCYDPRTCTWSLALAEITEAPSPRAYHSGATIGQFVYIYGGRNSTKQTLNDFWSFNTILSQWSRIRNPTSDIKNPTLYRHTMNPVGSHALFLCGGWEQTRKLASNAWLYDVNENTWKQFDESVNQRRAGHTTTNIDEVTLLVYGGEISNEKCTSRHLTANVLMTKFTCDGNIVSMR